MLEQEKQLDHALVQLGSATTPQTRFEILQELVRYWHGPIRSLDGFIDAELKSLSLPDPLLNWYRWAGRRTEIMSGQSWFCSPQASRAAPELSSEKGYLLFQRENQGVYEWATLPEGDDPPVFGRYTDERWVKEEVSLSEHLIVNCLFEAIMCHAPYSASNAWLRREQLAPILEHFSALPIPAWRWPGPTRFYFGGGAFMFTTSDPLGKADGQSVWLAAKYPNALTFLRPFVDNTWEHVEL